MGEKLPVATSMDTYTIREPLGVVAGIAPFNFPAMIPLWMFPPAIACGNTVLLKPSEKDPGATMILTKLAEEAGVPKGVLNIVHGGVDTVNFLCDAPPIKVRIEFLEIVIILVGYFFCWIRSSWKVYLQPRFTKWKTSSSKFRRKESWSHHGRC